MKEHLLRHSGPLRQSVREASVVQNPETNIVISSPGERSQGDFSVSPRNDKNPPCLTGEVSSAYAKGGQIMPALPGHPELPRRRLRRDPRPSEAGTARDIPHEQDMTEQLPVGSGQTKTTEQPSAPDKAPGEPGVLPPQLEKKRGIKGFMDRLKERKKKRKEEKKERSRQQVFRQYLKPVMDEAAMHFPGMHIEPQMLLGTGVMNKAYHTAFEKSGLALEGQFMAALYRKDPLVSQLYTSQVLTELQQRVVTEKAREIGRVAAKEPNGTAPEVQEEMQRVLEGLERSGVRIADHANGELAEIPQEFVDKVFDQEFPEARIARETVMGKNAQSDEVKQAAGADFTVLNQVRYPHGIRANHLIDTSGITNPNIAALLNTYNAEVAAGRADLTSIEQTREAIRNILSSNPGVEAEAAPKIVALSEEYDLVRAAIEHENETLRRLQYREQLDGEDARRDPRHLLGMVTDDEGQLLTRQRILADRRMRNKLFNDLYRLTDSRPQDFWQQAWDPLTQGMRELEFFNLVQGMSSSPNEQVEHIFAETGFQELNSYIQRNADILSQRLGRQIGPNAEYQTLASDAEKMIVIESVKASLRESFDNYQKERQIRENLHNVNAFLYRTQVKPDELFGYIQQFSGELADITNGIHGVTEMMDIYEDELRLAMLRHDGYLRPEDVLSTNKKKQVIEVDENGNRRVDVQTQVLPPMTEQRAKARLQEMYKKKLIYLRTDDGGQVGMHEVMGDRELAPWELDRIMTLARGNMIANQRLLSLASESRHPVGNTTRFGSYFLQDIIQAYSPNIHLNTKYWVPGYKTSSFLMWGEDREKLNLFGGKLQIRKRWNVKREYHRFHEWKDHTIQYTRDHEQIDANRQNPNRAGDAFTRIYAWKVGSHPGESNESITRDFLENGFDRMIELHVGHFSNQANPDFMNLLAQANITFNPNHPDGSAHVFRSQLPGVHYVNLDEYGKPADVHGHGHHPEATLEDIAATNLYLYQHGPDALRPENHDAIKQLRTGLNEYANWIGTGIQLELLHSALDDYEVKLRKGDAGKKKGVIEAREKGNKIVARMVELQPDKLFLVSRKIQDRVLNGFHGHTGLKDLWRQDASVNGVFNADKFNEVILRTTSDLKMLETDLLNDRDRLLFQEGKTFYGDGVTSTGKVELDMGRLSALIDAEHPVQQPGETQAAFTARVTQFQADKQDRLRRVEEFRQLIKADYEAHKSPASPSQRTEAVRHGHGSQREGYKPYTSYEEEFVTHKDFYHGFVLWTGDAPMEEFKMAAVGPTGAFARAAGNNITGMKISEAMTKLMSGIKNAHTPAEAVGLISPIYANLSQIDLDMANARVTQVADNVLKWYSADWRSSIPFAKWWFRYMGTASYAQKMYGKRMPVWYAHEKRHFVDLLKEQGYITPDEHKDLVDRHSARKGTEIPLNMIQSFGELLTVFLIYYVIKKALDKE